MVTILSLVSILFTTEPAQLPHTPDTYEAIILQDDLTQIISYYDNGKIREMGYLLKGKQEGCWCKYSETGNLLAKAYYNNGFKAGSWKIYANDGKLKYEITYKNGIRQFAKSYDENEELISYLLH
ncbi:MAG: hypothetical protein H7X71_06665 [Chitinophagales bacterium]|nr:hypothetical protein [Chitinophagales bacterium]